ncbi:hypothetical protein ACAF76_001035 [Brevibacillus sp. TJ4]|uniref:hypothetical protein n=1 Tax=Brevibacillus sp. TJ4 TaxID=3234853 RepID=UPI0037D10EBF
MRRASRWLSAGSLGLLLLLSACNNNQATPQQPQENQTHSGEHGAHTQQNGVTVIPSVDRDKQLTTNRDNNTFSGMGTSLYSTIGSSGLHAGGPSTNLESKLNAAGIHGVQALIVNDMIVIAPASANTSSINQADPMQAHLLSNVRGSSARSPEWPDGTSGTMGTKAQTQSFAHIRDQIERLYGSDAQVMTVTSREGLQAFEQVKKQMNDGNQNTLQAEQINTLLREAKRLP